MGGGWGIKQCKVAEEKIINSEEYEVYQKQYMDIMIWCNWKKSDLQSINVNVITKKSQCVIVCVLEYVCLPVEELILCYEDNHLFIGVVKQKG